MRFKSLSLLVVMSSFLSACTVIQPGERAVKVSLGTMDRNLLSPGMQTYFPLTDSIHTFSVKQENATGQCEPLTADQQPISITFNVLYRIPEGQVLILYEKYAGNPYERLVAPQIQEAFRQVVSGYKADSATKNVNIIKNSVLGMVRENVKGLVEVVDIPITHVGLPEVLQQAIAQKQVMEQQALQKSYELDKARKEAEITIANAEAQARSIQLQSLALQKSPALIEYERVKKWDGQLPTTMIIGGGSSGGSGWGSLIQMRDIPREKPVRESSRSKD
ncbi:MAG: prohibitin family protein [Candidatus Melainabacteria bacterium]|nr:prohibitin family protein [Candidatus Melainabacteria bacterium]